MRHLFFALLSLTTSASFASSIDCRGRIYNEDAYLSTNPVAPYNQFVKKSCGLAGPLDGDFYYVESPTPQYDSQRPCDIAHSMWELQIVTQNDNGRLLEYKLAFCRKGESCQALRGLKIEKSTGRGEFFNILEDGKLLSVSQSLSCTIKP